MTDLVPRPAAGAQRPGPSQLVGAATRRAPWGELVERLGWDVMPDHVRAGLQGAGVCRGGGLAAWAYDGGVRRSRATHTQYVEGWWADVEAFVRVEGRRPVAPEAPGSRRFHPSGVWDAAAVVHPVDGRLDIERWRRPRRTGGRRADRQASVTHVASALLLVPAAVRARLGAPTAWGAGRYPSGGGLRDRVVAYRRDGNRLIVLSAERSAGGFPDPETAIDDAPWVTTILEGTIGPGEFRELGPCGGLSSAGRGP